jgi:hypothetical protein
LPNGNTVAVNSLEDIEWLAEKIRRGEPIIVRVEVSGVVEESVTWEPDRRGGTQSRGSAFRRRNRES